MKHIHGLWFLVFMFVTSTAWSYGGGSSSSKVCAKPKFTEFVPADNTEVLVGSDFSFTATANTYPNTIHVTVKGLETPIVVLPQTEGNFLVSGKLPASLKGTYARIAINAEGQSNCKGADGWLVKIAE